MSARPAAKGGRDIVAFFAGHLANLFNGADALGPDDEFLSVKPFSLYERVRRSLVGNRRYSDQLVGVWSYPPPDGIDEAAEFYFDSVLDRPIGARRGEPTSADNLAALIASHAVGPHLVSDEPGSLSTWKALVGGPMKLRRFKPQGEVFELSNRILKCLDAANRPYAEVLRLGLCPKEWLVGDAAVGVNTLKAANAFLKALKAEMRGDLGRRPTKAELDAAFAAAPTPGCKDASDFAATLLGAAILTRIAGQDQTYMVSFDVIEATQAGDIAQDDDEPLMDAVEASPILDSAVAAGAIAAPERELLAAIFSGESLARAMSANLFLRRRLKQDFDGDIAAYVEDLSSRTARFVSKADAAESSGAPKSSVRP